MMTTIPSTTALCVAILGLLGIAFETAISNRISGCVVRSAGTRRIYATISSWLSRRFKDQA
jgi:hypothetical protein